MALLQPENQVGPRGRPARTPGFPLTSRFCCVLLLRPKNGSIILYNRKKVKYRNDGYSWKKRKDGKTTREDHLKLKVKGMVVRWRREPRRKGLSVTVAIQVSKR